MVTPLLVLLLVLVLPAVGVDEQQLLALSPLCHFQQLASSTRYTRFTDGGAHVNQIGPHTAQGAENADGSCKRQPENRQGALNLV